MEFTRDELQNIRDRAEKQASHPHLNEGWVRAFLRLADSANTLDAFMARTEVKIDDE